MCSSWSGLSAFDSSAWRDARGDVTPARLPRSACRLSYCIQRTDLPRRAATALGKQLFEVVSERERRKSTCEAETRREAGARDGPALEAETQPIRGCAAGAAARGAAYRLIDCGRLRATTGLLALRRMPKASTAEAKNSSALSLTGDDSPSPNKHVHPDTKYSRGRRSYNQSGIHMKHLLELTQHCRDAAAREPRERWGDMRNARKMNVLLADLNMPKPARMNRTAAPMLAGLLATLALAGCGAEVAGGVAAVGALQAQQAKQAQAQQAQVLEQLKAAQEAAAARAASAAD